MIVFIFHPFPTFFFREPSAVVLFSAVWAEECRQVEAALDSLSQKYGDKIKFANALAEEISEVSLKHAIEAVPTIIFFKNGIATDRIDGVDIALLSAKCEGLAPGVGGEDINERLKKLINTAKVMIFMKGNRTAPRCGFSKTLIEIMNSTGVSYETFDILTDEEVRSQLKIYSDWPTYPQVYVNGELIGGLDIIKEMVKSNELLPTLQS